MQPRKRMTPSGVRIGGIHDDSRFPRRTDAGPRPPQDGGPDAAAGGPHAELPRALAAARRVAPGHHLPGRQARAGPRRGGPPQHPLPRLPGPDGHGLVRRPAGRRHQDPGLGIRRRPGRDRQARPARPARRLLPAPLQPRHGQHPDPRDGLGRRRRALGRQHPVLLPLHARRLGQLRAAVAAAVRLGAGAHRPLPLERPGDGRRPPALRRRRWARPTSRPAGGRTRPRAAS